MPFSVRTSVGGSFFRLRTKAKMPIATSPASTRLNQIQRRCVALTADAAEGASNFCCMGAAGFSAGGVTAGAGCDSGVVSVANEATRSEEHTSELQSRQYLVCRLLLEKKKQSRI